MRRFTVVPAVYIILRRDDKILLIRRYNTGYRDGWYSLPSGHVDGNEPAIVAAAREAKEEVGVDIDLQNLKFVHVIHRLSEEGDHERVDFFFEAISWEGDPVNCEPDKCDDVQWFDVDRLPAQTAPLVEHALGCISRQEYYSDMDF